jgi:hypothetical protein
MLHTSCILRHTVQYSCILSCHPVAYTLYNAGDVVAQLAKATGRHQTEDAAVPGSNPAPPQSPERGQNIWLCITQKQTKNLSKWGVTARVKNSKKNLYNATYYCILSCHPVSPILSTCYIHPAIVILLLIYSLKKMSHSFFTNKLSFFGILTLSLFVPSLSSSPPQ